MYKPLQIVTQKTLRLIAPPNISPPGGLYMEFALEYKVKQSKKWQISFPLQASPIDLKTQISLRT